MLSHPRPCLCRPSETAPPHPNDGRRGIALVMALIITGVCMVIVTGLMQYIVSEYRYTFADWRRVQALYCAESGVERTIQALEANPNTTSLAETPLDNDVPGAEGTYEARIVPVQSGSAPDPLGAKQITVTSYVPNKAKPTATRTVTAIYSPVIWDFGADAVRARCGIDYASDQYMTVVVDENNNVITDPTVDASIRVTGTGATIGAVDSVAANKAVVSGSVFAPGWVDVPPENATGVISELNPANYVPNAFPPASTLGTWDGSGNLIWPPTPGTWAQDYLQQALAGGTTTASTGTFTGSKYIELGGSGTLNNATLTGPGTVFVHGNLGANVTNGAPPVTLVISGNFVTNGNDFYRFDPGSTTPAQVPSLVLFGPQAEIDGNSNWYLNGPLMAFNPSSRITINDSAITCFGALVSNGTVYFKSSYGALGYPRNLSQVHFTARGPAKLVSYSAR